MPVTYLKMRLAPGHEHRVLFGRLAAYGDGSAVKGGSKDIRLRMGESVQWLYACRSSEGRPKDASSMMFV